MDFSSISPISWYPGHMRKAERELGERLKLIDVVLELVDARAPQSSRNRQLSKILGSKARILVLNKTDLADPDANQEWLNTFRKQGLPCTSLHHQQKTAIGKLSRLIHETAEKDLLRRGGRNRLKGPTRAMIIGLPNVGKSSLINLLVQRRHTKVGPKPGVTRQQQWVAVDPQVDLLDTPGVTQARFDNVETGLKLGLLAMIKDQVIGIELLAEYLLHVFREQNPDALQRRYQLEVLPDSRQEFLEAVGRHAGYLIAGNRVDPHQAAELVVREFRQGILGRVTLERPVCPAPHQ